MSSTFTLGWADNSGVQVFALGWLDLPTADRLADPRTFGWGRGGRWTREKRSYRVESVQIAQQEIVQRGSVQAAVDYLEALVERIREQAELNAALRETLEQYLEALELLFLAGRRQGEELAVLMAIIEAYF